MRFADLLCFIMDLIIKFSEGFNSKIIIALFSQGRDCFLFVEVFPNDCLDLYDVDASGKCKHFVKVCLFPSLFQLPAFALPCVFVLLLLVNHDC